MTCLAPTNSPYAIEFSHVHFSYTEGSPALTDINLSIAKGEYVCILGSNGSGKSTLLQLINALLVPTAGSVHTCGYDTLNSEHLYDIRSNVGFVFQNPEEQIVASIVEDDIAFGPKNLRVEHALLQTRVNDALNKVGLAGFNNRDISTLSGGQKQRVAIAGALAMQPSILVLDEPTSMLDPQGRSELLQVIDELHAAGITVVVVSQFLEDAARARRVCVLEGGRLVFDGSPKDVLTDPSFAHALRPRETRIPVSPSKAGAALVKQADALLEFSSVSFTYFSAPALPADSTWALHDIDFRLHKGEVLGVAGRSGSGKSTLVQLTNGLLVPQEGVVSLCGNKVESIKQRSSNSALDIGLVFQNPEFQLFATFMYDDIAFGPTNTGLTRNEIDKRVRCALKQVNLPFEEFAHRNPFKLSGGEQRRVAIASALALQPKVLVFDEPFAGLDLAAQSDLCKLILELSQNDVGILIVSHDMDALASVSTNMLIIIDGSLVAYGSTSTILAQTELLAHAGLTR